jgi:hypothetical protein
MVIRRYFKKSINILSEYMYHNENSITYYVTNNNTGINITEMKSSLKLRVNVIV